MPHASRAALAAFLDSLDTACVVTVTPYGDHASPPQTFTLPPLPHPDQAEQREAPFEDEVDEDIYYLVERSPKPLTAEQLMLLIQEHKMGWTPDQVYKACARLTGSDPPRLVNPVRPKPRGYRIPGRTY